jgi:hypothetical protein
MGRRFEDPRCGVVLAFEGFRSNAQGGEATVIWLLVLVLLILAIGGGLALSKLLFFLLIAALVLALLGAFTNRSAV